MPTISSYSSGSQYTQFDDAALVLGVAEDGSAADVRAVRGIRQRECDFWDLLPCPVAGGR